MSGELKGMIGNEKIVFSPDPAKLGNLVNSNVKVTFVPPTAESRVLENWVSRPSADLERFERVLRELAADVKRLEKQGGTQNPALRNLEERLEDLRKTGAALTAPVLLPPSSAMEVRLVAAHALDRLEEYNHTFSVLLALVGIFCGAWAGAVVGAVTQPTPFQPTGTWWVLVVVLLVVTGVFSWMAYTTRSRANALKLRALHSPETASGVASTDVAPSPSPAGASSDSIDSA